MDLRVRNYNSSLVILYSSLLIVTCELLLAKISFQFFTVLSPLPILLVSLSIKYKDFLISVVFSFFQLSLIIYIFPEYLLNNQIIFFHLAISILILFFSLVCNLSTKNKFTSSNLIAMLILSFIVLLVIFYLIFLKNIEQQEIKIFFKRIVIEILDAYKVKPKKNIDEVVNILISILPSINTLIFFITFSFNLIFAKLVLKKININQNPQPDFNAFITPSWFSIIYLFATALVFINDSSSNIWIFSINTVICMSFCYLLEGYRKFNNFFKNLNLDRNIKFIIIFLLFIFLGYVLLLTILFLGFLENFKRIKNNLGKD